MWWSSCNICPSTTSNKASHQDREIHPVSVPLLEMMREIVGSGCNGPNIFPAYPLMDVIDRYHLLGRRQNELQRREFEELKTSTQISNASMKEYCRPSEGICKNLQDKPNHCREQYRFHDLTKMAKVRF